VRVAVFLQAPLRQILAMVAVVLAHLMVVHPKLVLQVR
jgi:hypothetical protein